MTQRTRTWLCLASLLITGPARDALGGPDEPKPPEHKAPAVRVVDGRIVIKAERREFTNAKGVTNFAVYDTGIALPCPRKYPPMKAPVPVRSDSTTPDLSTLFSQPDPSTRLAEIAARGYDRFAWRDYRKSAADYSEAILQDPLAPELYYNRGCALLACGENVRSVSDFKMAVRLGKNDPENYPGLAIALVTVGKTAQAFRVLDRSFQIGRPSAPVYSIRAGIREASGDLDGALADSDQAVKLEPNESRWYVSRAGVRYKRGEMKKAISDLDQAIRLDPNDAVEFNARGGLFLMMNQGDRALADFEQALLLDPMSAQYHVNLGMAWGEKGDYAWMEAECSEAIRLDPNFYLAYLDRAIALMKNHDYRNALDDYEQILRIQPDDLTALGNRAWLLASCPEDDLRDGRAAVTAAIRRCDLGDWKKAGDLDTLAAAFAETGDFPRAIDTQEKALALTTDPAKLEQFRKRLALYRENRPYRLSADD